MKERPMSPSLRDARRLSTMRGGVLVVSIGLMAPACHLIAGFQGAAFDQGGSGGGGEGAAGGVGAVGGNAGGGNAGGSGATGGEATGATGGEGGLGNGGIGGLGGGCGASDDDGIPDELDNCPCLDNPNQLDFDGDGVGNVCDVELYALSGTAALNATLHVDFNDECHPPATVIITDLQLRLRLDDDAMAMGVELDSLAFEVSDVEEDDWVPCDGTPLMPAPEYFLMSNSVLSAAGAPFSATAPYDFVDHEAGNFNTFVSAYPVMLATDVTLEGTASNPGIAVSITQSSTMESMGVATADAGDTLQVSWLNSDWFTINYQEQNGALDALRLTVGGAVSLEPR